MKIEERIYQQKCIRKCLEHFQDGIDSVMLESPVGSGKTIMGLSIAQKLNELHGGKLSCAWVAGAAEGSETEFRSESHAGLHVCENLSSLRYRGAR